MVTETTLVLLKLNRFERGKKACGCTEYMRTPSLSYLLLLGEKGGERGSQDAAEKGRLP